MDKKVYIVYFDSGPADETIDSVWSTQDLAYKRMDQITKEHKNNVYLTPACLMCFLVDKVED